MNEHLCAKPPKATQSRLREVLRERELRYRAIFNSTFQFIGVIELDGTVLDANDAALSFAGVSREDVIGRPAWETPWFVDDTLAQQRLRDAVVRAANGGFVRYEECIGGANSARATIDFSLKPVRGDDGELRFLVAEGRDITDAQVIRGGLRESERRFRLSFDRAPIGVALVAPDGEWLAVNQALCDMFGYSEEEMLRRTWQVLTHPEDLAGDAALLQETLDGRRSGYRYYKRYLHKGGRLVHAQLDVSLLRDEHGAPLHFIAQIQDISARRQAEESLFEAKELAQVTLASIAEGVIRTDARGLISYVNDAACTLTGIAREQLVGARFGDVVHLREQGRDVALPDPVDRLLRLGSEMVTEPFPRLVTVSGALRPISHTLAPILARDGALLGCVFVFQDVSDAHQIAEHWAFQARHDALTGVLNRRAFQEVVDGAAARVADAGAHFVVAMIDLDRFKLVNDSAGHAVGDRMLVAVARMLRRRLRSGDLIARLGGDEFALLLSDCSIEDAQRIAQTLLAAAGECAVVADGERYTPSLSIGLAALSADASDSLRRADTACFVAKEGGRGRVQLSRPDDRGLSRAEHERNWARRLVRAIDNDGFAMHRQPVLRLDDGSVIGHELLVRLAGDDDGPVAEPREFLPAARRLGLCAAIDLRVLRQALQLLAEAPGDDGFLIVNLSAQSIGDPLFAQRALSLLDAAGIPGARLRFEIIERDHAPYAIAPHSFLDELRRRGHALWLDDFGIGENSFETLRRLRPDGVKIHPDYVRGLTDDPLARCFVEAVCRAATEVGFEVLAEGVESAAIAEAVAALGIAQAQGYHLGGVVPVPAGGAD